MKAQCLQLMDLVVKTHEEFLLTRRGKSVARIVPVESVENPFGFLKGTVHTQEDIILL